MARHDLTLFFLILLTGASVAQAAKDAGIIRPKKPLCGVLTEKGHEPPAETFTPFQLQDLGLNLIVPTRLGRATVRRFSLGAKETVIPFTMYEGWWFCVTEGKVLKPSGGPESPYGLIEIKNYSIDQTTGERGQE